MKDSSLLRRNKPRLILIIALALVLAAATVIFITMTWDLSAKLEVAPAIQSRVYHGGFLALLAAIAVWIAYLIRRSASTGPENTPRAWFYPLISALISLFAISVAYSYIGMWPVGNTSAMIVDMHHQYAPLLSKLTGMFKGGGSLSYSFDVGLGTGFVSMFAYYLASPLNFILTLFPERLLDTGILFITLIKVALSAAAFTASAGYIFRRRSIAAVIGGLLYSGSMYMLAYSWNIMWLDGVILAPIVVMLFERLMRTGRLPAYSLSLAYLLFVNYYIAFMVCIFLVLWFFCWCVRTKRTMREKLVGLRRFAVGSLIGGGLAAFILIPVYLALGVTSASTANSSFPEFGANFNLLCFPAQHLFDVTPTIRSGNLPNVASGILTILALPLFISVDTIPFRRKFTMAVLWLVLAFSMPFNYVDLIWHGLHFPNDLPFRYSFLYSFVLIMILTELLLHVKDIKPSRIIISSVGLIAVICTDYFFGLPEISHESFCGSVILIAIFALALLLSKAAELNSGVTCAILLFLVTAEVMTNSANVLVGLDGNEHYTLHSDYTDNTINAAISTAVEETKKIAEEDGELFWRMEVKPRRTLVDSALHGYRGITVFSSSNYYSTTRMMNSLGYKSNGVNSYIYDNFVLPTDSLLGIKYLALQTKLSEESLLKNRSGFEYEDQSFYIYENESALSPAYMVSDGIKEFDFSYYDPIKTINGLYRAMCGSENDIFTVCPVYADTDSTKCTANMSSIYIPTKGSFNFYIPIEEKGQYYIYTDCRAAESISVAFSGINVSVTPHEPGIIDGGILNEGGRISVTLKTSGASSGNIFVVKLNDDVYGEYKEKLSDEQLEVTEFYGSNLAGKITAKADGVLMTSIPYDEGWQVTVDGKPVKAISVVGDAENPDSEGALLAVELAQGSHSIELSYTAPGFCLGLIISLASLAALILIFVFRKKHPPIASDEDRIEKDLGFFVTEPETAEAEVGTAPTDTDSMPSGNDSAEVPGEPAPENAENPLSEPDPAEEITEEKGDGDER